MAYEPIYLQTERTGKLKEIEAELWIILESCRLCPRQCGVNRLKGEKGFCSSTDKLKVHAAHLHFGEEKPLVRKGGSGTVFFSIAVTSLEAKGAAPPRREERQPRLVGLTTFC